MKKHYMPPEQILFYNTAIIGGFMGGFAMMRCFILGSAQTSNLINMTLDICKGNYIQALICVGSLIVYGISTAFIKVMNDKCKKYSHITSVIIDIVCIAVFALIPSDVNVILTLYPVYFMTAFMWNSFPGACGFVSSPIFSTNNYRQMIFGLTEYFETKSKQGLKRARFYFGTLTWFHIGAAFSYFADYYFHNAGVLFCLIFVFTALIQSAFEFKHYDVPKEEVQVLV